MENEARCCLCGSTDCREIAEDTYCCDDCIYDAVSEKFQSKRKKTGKWYNSKLNWGFWLLGIGFVAWLVTNVILPKFGIVLGGG